MAIREQTSDAPTMIAFSHACFWCKLFDTKRKLFTQIENEGCDNKA